MALQIQSNLVLYILFGLLLITISIFIYFLMQNRRQELIKKTLEEEIESEGFQLEKSKDEPSIEKKSLDEMFFFVGAVIAIVGFIIKHYILMAIGIIISFPAFLIYIALMKEKDNSPFHKKSDAELKNKQLSLSRLTPRNKITEEDMQLLKEKLSSGKMLIIKENKVSDYYHVLDSEIKEFLKLIKNLLKKLPKKEKSSFLNSKEFGLYEKIIKNTPRKINNDLKKLAYAIDDLLGKMSEKEISKFSESKEFGLYKKIMKNWLKIGLSGEIEERSELKNKISDQETLVSIATDIDKIHSLVLKYKNMTLKDIATILKADAKRVEELAKILDKYKIAELYYPSVGSAILRKIDVESKDGSKRNKKINLIIFTLILIVVVSAIIIILDLYGVL